MRRPGISTRWFLASGSLLAVQVAASSERPPAMEQTPQTQEGPAELAVLHAARAYRAGPVAERISIEFRRGGSSTLRSAELSYWIDRGDPYSSRAQSRPRRLRLDLGRLLVSIDGDHLLAIHKHNPTLYYEAQLTPRLSLETLSQALPPLPLPQIAWALSDEALSPESALHNIDDALPIDHPRIENDTDDRPDSPTIPVDLVGDAGSQFGASIDRGTGRLTEYWFGFSVGELPRRERALARAKVTKLDAGDPDRWSLDIAGRTRVETLAELKAQNPPIVPGTKLPNLGLMSAELEPASLDADFAAASAAEAARRRSSPLPTLGVFLIYDIAQADPDDVRTGVLAMMDCRPLHFDTSGTRWSPGPRVERVIPVMESGRFSATSIQTENARWADPAWLTDETTSPARPPESKPPARCWSASGSAALNALAPNLRSAIVVCNADQTVRALIPLDGRRPERVSVTRDLREALRAAWEPTDDPLGPSTLP